MKKTITNLLFLIGILSFTALMSCDEDLENCTGCPDDAPYGTIDGGCYATLSDCENNESGNCVICQ
ncbi:hypothetical protein [Marinoscillum sp.]|uniref:hypothetical protein n=1 Tax=Marinoscillum sp. TaxID=2024838 RepID=UPI003BAC3405